MKLVIAYCMLVVLAMTLPQTQCDKCSFARRDRYTVRCGFWSSNRCTKYRYTLDYQCCPGWTGAVSAGCPIRVEPELPDPEPERPDGAIP